MLHRISRRRAYAAGILASLCLAAPATADETPFAVEVVHYTPGAAPAGYQDPAAALGKTREFTPAIPEFEVPPQLVTPFNATYTPDDLVAIGDGGRLVLRLGRPALSSHGYALGVHAGVGLIDSDYPNGTISGPAFPYTSFRSADVRVSADGENWLSLGSDIVFELPTNWYAEGITTPGSQATAGTIQADFAQPFTGQLSDFDNTTWPEMLGILDGSAGGTWFDLSSLPAAAVSYVEFTVSGEGEVMYLDAVVSVPEPAGAAILLPGLVLLRRRRG